MKCDLTYRKRNMEATETDAHQSDDSELSNHVEGEGENITPLTDNSINLLDIKLLSQNCDDSLNGDAKTPHRLKSSIQRSFGDKNRENCGQGDYDIENANSFTSFDATTESMFSRKHIEESNSTSSITTTTDSTTVDAGLIFYGINAPAGALANADEDINQVYTDKKEALRAIKKCKGARFKVFKTEVEALEFANSQSEQLSLSRCSDSLSDLNTTTTGEKTCGFRGPKNQDLVKLRKAIECGDIETVIETIWSNPRYLVSSGDTPTILQEGSRYNALHVAAKMKQFEIAKLILNIVEDEEFMKLLYNDDSKTTCMERVHFLTDLYLNTPDKGLCETPLHFASKFGCVEIVNLLVSHPICDLKLKNKYGQIAAEIICTRCPSETPELKSQIEDCFQNRYYIPVLRSSDNAKLPSVGEPWSPTFKKPLLPTNSNPMDFPMSVKAYAGPMSPTQAAEFHKKISTPVRSKTNKSIAKSDKSYDAKLSDADKGLERVCRELASEMRVGWTEYWPFLKSYCDLSKSEGLCKLENFLKNKYNELMARKPLEQDSLFQDSNLNTSTDSISSLCYALRNFHIDSGSYSSDSPSNTSTCICPKRMRCHSGPPTFRDTNTSLSMDIFLQRTCQVIGDQIFNESSRFIQALEEENFTYLQNPYKSFGKAILPYVKCLYDIAERLSEEPAAKENFKTIHKNVALHVTKMITINEENSVREFFRVLTLPDTELLMLSDLSDDDVEFGERVQKIRRKKNKSLVVLIGNHLKCMLNMLCVTAKDACKGESKECDCVWSHAQSEDEEDEVSEDGGSGKDVSKPINVGIESTGAEESVLSKSLQSAASDTSTDLYFTPEGSWQSSRCSSMSEAWTPEEGLAVFIEGFSPSKVDVDVLRAIENTVVDPILYPNIHRWKFFMTTGSHDQGESFSDSFQVLRSPNSLRHSNHPITSTPSRAYRKPLFIDRINPF